MGTKGNLMTPMSGDEILELASKVAAQFAAKVPTVLDVDELAAIAAERAVVVMPKYDPARCSLQWWLSCCMWRAMQRSAMLEKREGHAQLFDQPKDLPEVGSEFEQDDMVKRLLRLAENNLDNRRREVIYRHLWMNQTYAEIGRDLKVSREYVRVLYTSSIAKLKKLVRRKA